MSDATPAPKPSRVDWIDIARGGTILFVVIHHAMLAALQIGPVQGHLKLMNFTIAQDIRMPLFFFCSGLLACWGLAKPVSVIFERRVLVLLWIIALWTGLHLVVNEFVLLYPWHGEEDEVNRLVETLWTPFGNVWFIYAILSVTVIMLCLRRLPVYLQMGGVIFVLGLLDTFVVGKVPGLDERSFVGLIAEYALACFAIGYWLAPVTVRFFASAKRSIAAIALGTVIWIGMDWGGSAITGGASLPTMMVSLPALFVGLGIARMLSELRWAAAPLRWVGGRTLEIFLLHQIFIAIVFAGLVSYTNASGTIALLVLSTTAIAGSVVLQKAIAWLGVPFLFRPPSAPHWLRPARVGTA